MTAGPTSATRPHNRKQLIVEAAAQVFSGRGYHAASMEEIAAAVGISAAALYRHFPNKYALFAECANVMADRLVAALDESPPGAALTDVLARLIRVTVAHRAAGGLYRWEARYLDRDDRRLLRTKFGQVVDRVTEMVRQEFPSPGSSSPGSRSPGSPSPGPLSPGPLSAGPPARAFPPPGSPPPGSPPPGVPGPGFGPPGSPPFGFAPSGSRAHGSSPSGSSPSGSSPSGSSPSGSSPSGSPPPGSPVPGSPPSGSAAHAFPLPGERLRAVAALGAIGSVTMHHTSIAQRRIEDLLLAAALRVAATDPAAAEGSAHLVELPAQPVPRTRRAEILAAAVPLFAREGFATVTNGQIAQAVGLAPSAIYRHYPGKVDILVAACLQAAGLLAQAVERSLHQATGPHQAIVALTAAYVAYSFEHNALNSVAEAEIVGLPASLQRPLILAQREHIAVWEQQLRLARPELDPRQARLLVHAGFGVVVEAGRALRWQDTPAHRDTVTALVAGALIG